MRKLIIKDEDEMKQNYEKKTPKLYIVIRRMISHTEIT
jgi:hypothetical protein